MKVGLRAQQPLLFKVTHPGQLGLADRVMRTLPLPGQASSRRFQLGDIPTLQLRNHRADLRHGHILVYIHGGGFAMGSPETHRAFAARLMQAGCFERVLMPDYRLAPEHPFPAANEDCLAFWQALLLESGIESIALAGESAGANLCLGICLQARDAGIQQPSRVFLHSPWLDVSLSGASYLDPDLNDAFIGRQSSRRQWLEKVFARHYAATTDPRHSLMSPIFAELSGLPALYIQLGSDELFIDDSRALHAGCIAAGTDCTLEIWPGMWHGFAMLAPLLPEANRALLQAARWLAA